jgi:hypothetical protein
VRHGVVEWDARRIGVAIGSGAVAVVLTCALGVSAYGAQAAAAASLIGALIFNGRAIGMALAKPASLQSERYVLKPNPPPTCSVWPVTKPAS